MFCKYLSIAMLLTLLLTSCGSAHTGEAAGDSAVSEEAQSFGIISIAEEPSQAAEITAPAETEAAEAEPTVSAEISESDTAQEEEDATLLAVKSVLCCEYLDKLTYDGTDPVFFWRAVAYLANLTAATDLRLSESQLAILVDTLFGTYTEQYPSLGEENPLVTWELQSDGAETYCVTEWDLSEITVSMTQPELQEDGSYLSTASLQENHTLMGQYLITLTASSSDNTLAPYSITAISPC